MKKENKCFSKKTVVSAVLDHRREIWDLDENTGFTSHKIQNKRYLLRTDIPNTHQTLMYIYLIDMYIKNIIHGCERSINLAIRKNCLSGVTILINTPYTLQEITKNSIFEGMNKPKGVYFKKCDLHTLMDNEYLASSRHIMLKLRNESGKLMSWNYMRNLILHELAHTMCNHVIYRDSGNHQKKDFHKYNTFLLLIDKKVA